MWRGRPSSHVGCGCGCGVSGEACPYAASSSTIRWRFYDEGRFYRVVDGYYNLPLVVTSDKCGRSYYTRCLSGSGAANVDMTRH
ncbi:hypothetical protein QEZ54_09535 [Catellatospora sp. KI3]|uniref:hypothetical protein n=1 Tax=Catellatospora sp. KI3 TaxID=3041620 RepID=UPI0024828EC3|nr:hypothetical protein [Catellatospora sp. KI3]MDI1461207.1 hypothetical protein [Catellatospora sp. KI3]